MRISRRHLPRALMLALVASLSADPASATPFSLWIGNDTNSSLPVLNTDTSGNLLRTGGNVNVTGFAVDVANNVIYYGAGTFEGSPITPRDLASLAAVGPDFNSPSTVFGEDMTFDGSSIWRTDALSPNVVAINPTTGLQTSSFTHPLGSGLGIAWDGSGFWLTRFGGGTVMRVDSLGNPTGESFDTGLTFAGGLAWDPRDSTLFLGTFSEVRHYTTTGTQLGSFLTGDGRFVDGLELEGGSVVPEPASVLLLGLGLAALGFTRRRATSR